MLPAKLVKFLLIYRTVFIYGLLNELVVFEVNCQQAIFQNQVIQLCPLNTFYWERREANLILAYINPKFSFGNEIKYAKQKGYNSRNVIIESKNPYHWQVCQASPDGTEIAFFLSEKNFEQGKNNS